MQYPCQGSLPKDTGPRCQAFPELGCSRTRGSPVHPSLLNGPGLASLGTVPFYRTASQAIEPIGNIALVIAVIMNPASTLSIPSSPHRNHG
jgi:hypothetical protein